MISVTDLINYDITDTDLAKQVANHLTIGVKQTTATLELLRDGATVPFISRYRKEMTGGLDEVQIHDVQVTARHIKDLTDRKKTVLKAIATQQKLTATLQAAIITAATLQDVEDLYLPYKQKKRTKAMIARENGLQPLADFVLTHLSEEIPTEAYMNDALADTDAVLAGLHEIIAEQIGEKAIYRQWLRERMQRDGFLTVTVKRDGEEKDAQGVYAQYYDYRESLKSLQTNTFRILAVNRGEKDGVLSVKIDFSEERMRHFIQIKERNGQGDSGEGYQVLLSAIDDAYKRFIQPAVARELRQELTVLAQGQAIKVFGDNLYHLLMQAPLKNKIVMGFDPGFRTGSKLAIIDANGRFLKKKLFIHISQLVKSSDKKQPSFFKV